MKEQVLFGDFFELQESKTARVYHPMSDRNKLSQILEEYYLRMNYGNTKVNKTKNHWEIVIYTMYPYSCASVPFQFMFNILNPACLLVFFLKEKKNYFIWFFI